MRQEESDQRGADAGSAAKAAEAEGADGENISSVNREQSGDPAQKNGEKIEGQ